MTSAVVDASVVVNVLLAGQDQDIEALAAYDALHAPTHLDVECISALRGRFLRGDLTAAEFVDTSLLVSRMPVIRHHIEPLVPRILALSANATAYDAAYLALAEALDADLLTADARLAAVPGVGCEIKVL